MTTRPPDDPRNGPVILRRQLLADGLTDRAIARLVANGTLHRIRHGAYTSGATWRQLDPLGRHGLATRAVLAQSRSDAVASHISALSEYDAPTWGVDLSTVHTTRRDQRGSRREAGVCQHVGRLRKEDIVERNGMPVTAGTRTALDVTTVLDVEPALVVVNHLIHVGETDKARLEADSELMRLWPRTLCTDLVLRLATGRCESIAETRTLYLCFRQGLPMPEINYEIKDSVGRVLYRVDFAWPEYGVFLEFDGRVKYEQLLRPGESASHVVLREKEREKHICRLTGWTCLRIVWADLDRPAATGHLIREALYRSPRAA